VPSRDPIALRRPSLLASLLPSGVAELTLALALWIGGSWQAEAQEGLRDEQTAASAEPGPGRARRLADAQALLRLKNAPAAASLLWSVVALGPAGDELTYREALYTLGEALYQQGEVRTAQRVLTQLASLSPPSPRAPLALVRLLELASEPGASSDDRADEWIGQLSRIPAAERPAAAGYVVGRNLLLRKRYADAKAALDALLRDSPGSPYALRARYLSGAALVALDKLGEAESEFNAVVSQPLPEFDDDRRTVELAHLALGRIHHARGDSQKAHQAYLHISQKSDLFRDAIYEAAWAAIRAKDFERAEQSLQLLLLAYRDAHETSYAATEAKMLLGNLLLRRGEPDQALEWFNQARLDATPVVDALAERMARPEPERLSALIAADPRGFDLGKLAPGAALPLLRSDPDIVRFLATQRDIASISRALDEIELTIAFLDRQLLAAGPESAAELRVAVARERDEARSYRRVLDQAIREAAQSGGALLAAAGQNVHKRFAEVLLRAEAGAVDVAWARKVQSSEHVSGLVKEEKRDLRILDDEFGTPPAPPSEKDKAPPALPGDMPADVAADLLRYLETAESLRASLVEAGQQGYKVRRGEVSKEYAERIRSEETEERARRVQAIAQFEQFLARYPSHPRFAPDAMFRLAELYFERSSEEFAAAVKRQGDASDSSGLPDFSQSVALYQRLLREHPRYRLVDGVHYLLGYCLGEMGKEAESRQAFLGLVCSNQQRALDPPAPWPGRKPKTPPYQGCQALKGDSRFIAETWTRLGEQHFDRGELDAAIASYAQVLPFRDSPFFDKALYKLAWSQYRKDHFEEAVRRFDELVVFADHQTQAAQNKTESNVPGAPAELPVPGVRRRVPDKQGSSLRGEAVQYLALSFAERDWNGDGRADAEFGIPRLEQFYRGRESEPHVREVLIRLGDIWFERTEFARAADAYQKAIARSPLAPDSPKLQERVVAAYDRLRSFEQALRAREALSRDYAPGSAWYEENKGDADSLASAAELADASLLHAITNRHASAQDLRQKAMAKKDAKLLAQARDGYRQAAESYASYLKQHPESKSAYEYSYLYAESLFYAGEYAAAAAAYVRVRDADRKGSHLEEAAYGAVKAQEHVALGALRGAAKPADSDGDDASQKLDEKLPPLPVVGKVTGPVSPLAMPPEVEDLQTAYERYVALVPDAAPDAALPHTDAAKDAKAAKPVQPLERSSLMAYKSAELDFRYQRFDRARQRFSFVLDRYCQTERAVDAGNAIIVSHTIDGNLDQVESWTGRIQAKGCGGGSVLASQQRDNLKKLSDDVTFKKAEQLLDAKRYELAANMFVALVEKNPRGPSADKAVNNAAVAYENLKRYGLAAGLYERLVRDYPQSPLADEAIFRAAVNQQRLFMFDKALLAYRALATLPRYAKSPHRHDALYNAALLADRDGDTALGIELWHSYQADPATSPAEANEAAYRAALLTDRERTSNPQRSIEEWERFLRRAAGQAESDPQLLGRVVEGHFRIGRARDAERNPVDARESYLKAAKLGSRLQPASEPAEFAAHAAFILAERRIGELERLRIGGSGSELEQSISRFNSDVTAAIGEYEKVLSFRRATWTLAAYYRMGYVTELYAKALLAAPCPTEVRRLGESACGLYRTKIEENVSQIEEKAIARYAVTLEQAGRLGVGNTWTREARARLTSYRPDKYPQLHDERVAQGLDAGSQNPSAAGSQQARSLAEAREALQNRQYEAAMVLARQVLSEDERSAPAILLLARAYYQRGKIDLAAALVGAAQQIDEQSGEAYLLLGLIALARDDGDRIAATAAFKRATELDPNLGLAWHNLAAQYLLAKNYPQALAAAQRAAGLLSGSGASPVQLNLGSALRGLGRYGEAIDTYRRLLERDPQYGDAYFNLGILYLDAPALPDTDAASQKRTALQYLMRYQDVGRGGRDEQVEAAIKEARAAVDREERKQRRKPGGAP